MVDRLFSEPKLAALYDLLAPWGEPDDHFYIDYVMASEAVLDVGCGTGLLLQEARRAGHTGRLVGLDPAEAMLSVAHARQDIEWVLGDLSTIAWEAQFDLIVMTGHAFQVLLSDEQVRTALTAVRNALRDEGRFVFETRNPQVRAWADWTPERITEIVTAAGELVRFSRKVTEPVEGDRVSFTATFDGEMWDHPELSWSTLRFLAAEKLAAFLAEAGLAIDEQYGDWDRSPLMAASPEIITLARPDTRTIS